MRPLKVSTPQWEYPIYFVNRQWDQLAKTLTARFPKSTLGIVTSPTVKRHHFKPLANALKKQKANYRVFEIPDGEEHKTLATVEALYGQLIEAEMGRNDPLIALGGGVIGDMVGFTAATYLRGVPFVQVPTTLLAQVDSSVGGKTGVDHPLGKNLIGAFYQPHLVWIDLSTLTTLPPRQIRAGLAEIVKYGAIADRKLFNTLIKLSDTRLNKAFLTSDALAQIIRRSCQIKADIVGADEKEITGLRSLLNFGHTLGHAIEGACGYSAYLHGEAVAIGMVLAAKLSERLGKCSHRDVEALETCLRSFGLETALKPTLSAETLLDYIKRDKKRSGDRVKFVLIEGIGKASLYSLTFNELAHHLSDLL